MTAPGPGREAHLNRAGTATQALGGKEKHRKTRSTQERHRWAQAMCPGDKLAVLSVFASPSCALACPQRRAGLPAGPRLSPGLAFGCLLIHRKLPETLSAATPEAPCFSGTLETSHGISPGGLSEGRCALWTQVSVTSGLRSKLTCSADHLPARDVETAPRWRVPSVVSPRTGVTDVRSEL